MKKSKKAFKLFEKTEEKYKKVEMLPSNSGLELLLWCAEETLTSDSHDWSIPHDTEGTYHKSYMKMKDEAFTIDDIQSMFNSKTFEQMTKRDNFWTLGLMVSAAIRIQQSYHNEKKITIDTNSLCKNMDYMGYRIKEGELTIKGDVGNRFGLFMSGGIMRLEGNCGTESGRAMGGGSITIMGNTGSHLASFMHDGNIIVVGDTGSHAGYYMENGHISINQRAGMKAGYKMQGGTLIMRNAGSKVGHRLKGGKVVIVDKYTSLGEPETGKIVNYKGKIFDK